MYTKRFAELRVVRFWRLTPIEWDAIQCEDAKAEMIAFYNVENKMASYDAKLREDKNKQKK